jgi:hypothetical protein
MNAISGEILSMVYTVYLQKLHEYCHGKSQHIGCRSFSPITWMSRFGSAEPAAQVSIWNTICTTAATRLLPMLAQSWFALTTSKKSLCGYQKASD